MSILIYKNVETGERGVCDDNDDEKEIVVGKLAKEIMDLSDPGGDCQVSDVLEILEKYNLLK